MVMGTERLVSDCYVIIFSSSCWNDGQQHLMLLVIDSENLSLSYFSIFVYQVLKILWDIFYSSHINFEGNWRFSGRNVVKLKICIKSCILSLINTVLNADHGL